MKDYWANSEDIIAPVIGPASPNPGRPKHLCLTSSDFQPKMRNDNGDYRIPVAAKSIEGIEGMGLSSVVARDLGISVSWVSVLVQRGIVPCVRKGKYVYVKPEDVSKAMKHD
jgi:hypothetical protein